MFFICPSRKGSADALHVEFHTNHALVSKSVTIKSLMFRRQTSDEPGLERLDLRVFINDVVSDPTDDKLFTISGCCNKNVVATTVDGFVDLLTQIIHHCFGAPE